MMFLDEPREPFASFLGYLLSWAGARSRQNFAGALEPLGIDARHWVVLVVLADEEGLTQHDLAARTSIDPSSMVKILDELEEMGLAERRPHPLDRRKRSVRVTARGRKTWEKASEAIGKAQVEFQAPLSEDEREQLRRLLRKLAGVEP